MTPANSRQSQKRNAAVAELHFCGGTARSMNSKFLASIGALSSLLGAAEPASAFEPARFLNAPASATAPAAASAVQYELELRLHGSSGFTQALLEAGIDRVDVANASRLASDQLSHDSSRCDVKISISKTIGRDAFSLVRVMLTSEAGQIVIERRGADLVLASKAAARKFPRLV